MSIRLRLTIYWSAITALILLAAGLLIMAMFARATWGALDAALMEEADTAAGALTRANLAQARLVLGRLSRERDLGPGRRLRLLAGGRVILDAGDSAADLPDASDAAASRTMLDGARGRYRYAIVAFSFAGAAAALEDGADAAPARRAIAHLRSALLLAVPLILALSAAGGYWMAAWALAPLGEIAGALARIGPRDLRRRLAPPRAQAEAARLIGAINQLLERLELASAAQQRFISEAAHELRTPLAVLRSGLEVTLQRPRGAAESRGALEQAMGEVERLCAIAEDLLALARLEAEPAAERAPVNLAEIAAEAAAMARTLAEARHQEFACEAGERLMVGGSAADLRRVILNLLDNAIKFTPEHGRVELRVSGDGPMALVAVRDSGPGIDAGDIKRVFDPFYRGRGANGAGSGLGLALSREVVRRHGGTIEAANRTSANPTSVDRTSADRTSGGCEIRVRLPLLDR